MPGISVAPGLEREGMAFVLHLITVEGLLGGEAAADPTLHYSRTSGSRLRPTSGAFKLYHQRVNVKRLTLWVNRSLTTVRDGDTLQASKNAGGVQFGA